MDLGKPLQEEPLLVPEREVRPEEAPVKEPSPQPEREPEKIPS